MKYVWLIRVINRDLLITKYMNFIDTHAHIYSEEFNENRNEVIVKSIEVGVTKILMPNVNSESIYPMLEIESKYPSTCYPMMGLHPTYVKENYKHELSVVKEWLFKRKFIAIGEIGIDLYWDKTFLAQQQEVFAQQIEWAKELNLPIVIHARDSFNEIFEVLDALNTSNLSGLFHSFSGGCREVDKILSYGGFKMAINGVVTFKNSKLDEVAKYAGLQNLLLETDTPYLTPHPHRGKTNMPEYIPLIAAKLASCFNCTIDEIATITTQNANKLFSLE